MNIYISQVYIRVGIDYSFTHGFQRWLSENLTQMVEPSSKFVSKFGADYNLIFNVSAKAGIQLPEIKGPTVYRKTKDVEFTVFLPHAGAKAIELNTHLLAFRFLLDGITSVLHSLDIDTSKIIESLDALAERLRSDASMISVCD